MKKFYFFYQHCLAKNQGSNLSSYSRTTNPESVSGMGAKSYFCLLSFLTLYLISFCNLAVMAVHPPENMKEVAAPKLDGPISALAGSTAPLMCSGHAVAVANYNDPDNNMNVTYALGASDENYASIGYLEYITFDLAGINIPEGNSVTVNWRKDPGSGDGLAYLFESTDGDHWQEIEVNVFVSNETFSGYNVSLTEGMRYLTILNQSYYWLSVESITTTYPCECNGGTIALTSGIDYQTICESTEITPIIYTIGGDATGASLSPEPPSGISGNYDPTAMTFTISGTPTVEGTYLYTLTTSGTPSPCTDTSVSGTITVNDTPSAPGIDVLNNCGNSVLTATGYTGALNWSTGETSAFITVSSGGTYSVTQTIGECTSLPGETTVVIQASPVALAPTTGDGSSGNPYQIASLENLYWITSTPAVWDKHFIQTDFIDASATASWCTGGWMPIGDYWVNMGSEIHVFSGNYNGQNHSISGLHITSSSSAAYGLFGTAIGATLKNLDIINVQISGVAGPAGALVGYANGVTIDNCYSSGSVSSATSDAGGLAGNHSSGSAMANCHSTCNVTGTRNVGGLIGSNTSNSTVTNCYHDTGTVDGSGNFMSITGGLVGANSGASVSKCYSTGTVAGYDNTGGLVGYNYSNATISNSYSRSSCSGHPSFSTNSGGLVGHNHLNSAIIHCYSTGLVGELMGGLAGYQSEGAITVSSYWDMGTSRKVYSSAGTGKTTAEMKVSSTFADWDFINIWGINAANNDEYPYFLPEPVCSGGTIALTGGSDNQTVCAGTSILNIRYTIGGGAQGASVSPELPAGLTGFYSSDTKTFTIGGTPTVGGVYAYTVTTSGSSPCNEATASGTIHVTAKPAPPVITTQNFCGYTLLTATDYSGDLLWSTGETTAVIQANAGGLYTVIQTVNECISDYAEADVTVSTMPEAGEITGPASTILAGQTTNLSVTGGDPSGTWASSQTDVATVDATGKVTGVGPGTATITYTVEGETGCEGESDIADFAIKVGILISQNFVGSGTFTVPANVTSINAKAWGGGGGAAGRNTYTGYAGGGGGGGGFRGGTLSVSPADIITVTVGKGGPWWFGGKP